MAPLNTTEVLAAAYNDPSFNSSGLSVELDSPTSLQFGPDGRLYVSEQYGMIRALTVEPINDTHFNVTDVENITTIVDDIPNHDDDGSLNENVQDRLVTGILVTGTAENPVLYVTSSDPRIGGGSSGEDLPLDTNSGVLSRLRWNGTGWNHTQLVRGLPRSEENHHPNGMALDEANGTLYIAEGGNTNKGAPSNNFAYLPEYALSAAVLSVNLTAIGNSTYDIPTLKNTSDPFGGQEGDNQAIITEDGPVQVYAPGFRNAYDLVLTQDNQLYTIDNGANSDWGGTPVNEGPEGTCTNEPNENNSDTTPDALHYIPREGYYGGHPNPTRGNESEYPGAVPSTYDRPVECDFLQPGAEDDSLVNFSSSTNGIDEYTSNAFEGAMKEDLLAAGFDGNIWRLELNESGSGVVSKTALFSNFGSKPLDVTTQGNDETYNGTVWAATYGSSAITVFTPTTNDACLGTDDPSLDEDGDGFSNADEIDNGADPCSPASIPPDNDGDDISDLNDFDDDNDGTSDLRDPFAIDASNGQQLPVDFQFKPGSYEGTLLELGFTGVMANGVDDYRTLYDESKLTAGGAANVLSLDAIPEGDAYRANNTQMYGFQVGVKPEGKRFTAHTTLKSPFPDDGGTTPVDYQSQGLFVGTGDQDNYVKLVVSANGGDGGIHLAREVDGTFESVAEPTVPNVTGSGRTIDLYLTVDPANDTVTAFYSIDGGENVTVSTASFPGSWAANSEQGLALGLISTSRGPGEPFSGTWTRLETSKGKLSSGNQPPSATFDHSPTSPTPDETVAFNGSESSDIDGTIESYEWDLDGDGTIDATGEEVTYTYSTTGDKTATLTVTDDDGATDQLSKTVTVSSDNQPPTAEFVYSPFSPAVDETVMFNGTESSDSDGTIESYGWDFDGDGTTDTVGKNATYTYSTAGDKTVTLTVTDDDGATDQTAKTVTVTENETGPEEVSVSITADAGINASTYSSGSFQVSNTGEGNVTTVVFNLSTAYLPDMVFDPNGTAGDTTAKDFSVDSGGSATGYASHDLRRPHEGNSDDGYDVLVVNFTDFQPGETFGFSIDVDPTSIKGVSAPGPAESGSVSGLELTRSTVAVTYDNGTVQSMTPFSDGSEGGSQAVVKTNAAAAPNIDVQNVTLQTTTLSEDTTAATVAEAKQTVEVTGPAGATVRLLRTEAGLFTDGVPDGGYDLEDYEGNSVINISETTATIGADGTANIGVTLTNTTDDAGLNYLTAVVEDDAGNTGLVSNVVVLQYDPNATATQPATAELTSCGVIDSPGTYTLTADITNSSAKPCLHVTSSDVVIDGAANTLDGGTSSTGSAHKGVLVGQTGLNPETVNNVTVKDLFVTNWSTGIYYGRASGGRIENNQVGDSIVGIQLSGDSANRNHTVIGNRVANTTKGIALEGTRNSEIRDNDVSGNYDGLYLFNARGNAIQDHTSKENTRWAVLLAESGPDNEFRNVTVGGTRASFEGRNVSVASRSSLPSVPDEKDEIGKYVKTEKTGGSAFLNLTIRYEEADISGLNESTLSMWRYNGSWTETEGTVLDTGTNLVSVNSTRLGTFAPLADEPPVVYRVNAGGPNITALDNDTDWSTDTSSNPSPYTNAAAADSTTYSTSDAITLDGSVPSDTPAAAFQTERWDRSTGAEMQWSFPVEGGVTYEVRLYFAEIYFDGDGERVFDVSVENNVVLDNYDIHADVGHDTGTMKSFQVTPDSTLNVNFTHEIDNPKINAIEIVKLDDTETSTTNQPPTANFSYSPTDPLVDETVTFDGSSSSDPDGTIESYEWDFDGDGTIDAVGENATYNYSESGDYTATLTVTDNDSATDQTSKTLTVGQTESGVGVAYRVNAGGPELAALDDASNWSTDTSSNPSTYTNANDADSKTFSYQDEITLDDSVPSSTPVELFQSERFDPSSGTNMQWDFPVDANATYEVRLYFAEIYFKETNKRSFDVTLEAEDTIVLNDYDIVADVGHDVGVMKAFRITPDATLDIDFYREVENPKVSGFELIKVTNNTDNVAPTANFTYSPAEPAVNETITFNGSTSSDSDGSIQSYEWDFDGDGTTDATGEEATYTYASNGTKQVVLTVADEDGAANLVSKPVNVTDSGG